ncbi:sensor histidine kinase [Phytohabitans kaempferiae]|uniref:histidine kinase n=1 Tax=Phytohabitans kaempferiae TaxID=1620943 RepID=A0ABV6MFK8_9ACTN
MVVLRSWLLPALLAAGQAALWPGIPLLLGRPLDRVEVAGALAATVLATVALGWRRRSPVAALAVIIPALTLGLIATPRDALLVLIFTDVIALYSVGVRRPARVTFAVTVTLIAWQAAVGILLYHDVREYFGNVVITVVVYLLAAGLGRSRRRWRAARREAADRLARAETDRRQASVQERQRLARELHDVSAHHLTSIVVTATAAQRLAGRRPELAAEALEFAARTGRETQSALHRLVAVMRGVELEGGSGLGARIEELAAGFAALGQPVTTRVSAAPITGPVAEAAYGIAREALTNALRHAPGGAVEVTLGQRDGLLEVVVANSAASAPGAAGGLGSGSGIDGMRERAESAGGTLEAGPQPDGGWRVRALLPESITSTMDRSLRRTRGPRLADIAVALAAGVLPVALMLIPDPTMPRVGASAAALATMLAAAHALPLLWRRRAPWPVLGAVLATTALWPLVAALELLPATATAALFAGIGSDLVAVYAVAARGRPRHLTWLCVPLVGGVHAAVTVLTYALDGWLLEQPISPGLMVILIAPTAVPFLAVIVPVWTAGFMVRLRRDGVVSRERRAVAASTAGAVELAYAERLRIAAGLRAAVLRHAAQVTAAAEGGRLDEVLDSARAALAAMRDLLGDLRVDPERAPQPTAAAIDALCRELSAAGRRVELHSPTPAPALPPAVDVSAYRVVETALGAGDAGPARVTLGYGPADLRITVTGVPSATAGPVAAGLRARVAAIGGRMTVDQTGTMDVWLPSRS